MFELLLLGFAALAGKAVHFEIIDGEDNQQPQYQPAQGYPPMQYAQSQYQPQQYAHVNEVRDMGSQAQGAYDEEWSSFIVSVAIGRHETPMIYDTGASFVILNMFDARAIGVRDLRNGFNYPVSTAGGLAYGKRVIIPTLTLTDGGIVQAHNVDALIMQRNKPSLLGQSALRQFRTEQHGDRITFRRA
jgi:clan AA aspartic protease (TIGR02281 family)